MRVRRAFDALALVVPLGALTLAAVVLAHSRWIGISDDDASRTLIAWDFARHPSFDATRSSWLPAHTWWLGAVLAVSHELAWTPRIASFAAALACSALAFAWVRATGRRSRACAALAAVFGVACPWSIYCAWASGVPEMPCCALLLLGVLALATPDGSPASPARSVAAGVALTAACGHRYEAWFATAAIVLATVATDRRRAPWATLALVATASLFPIAWLITNHARAGDALDFVHRVARYRAAHESLPPLGLRVFRYPVLLFQTAGLVVALAVVGARAVGRASVALVAGASGVIAGLVLGDAQGSGPTHHPARALLAVVWLLAPLAAVGVGVLATRSRAMACAVAAAAIVQLASAGPSPPREIDPASVAAGRAVGALSAGRCYVVEMGRLDALEVELASGSPENARADRTWGASAPSPEALDALAASCPRAAVHEDATEAALVRDGLVRVERDGAWRVLERR